MGIEADAQKDLELNSEDAENVVGGKKAAAKKKAAATHKATAAAGHSLPPIIVHIPETAVPYVQPDDCDPDDATSSRRSDAAEPHQTSSSISFEKEEQE